MPKIKLNKLQARTLALFQELARHPETAMTNPETGEVTITQMPHPHGDHMHLGDLVISTRDASGFTNEAVWIALERKGLARGAFPLSITLTEAGMSFDTGLLPPTVQKSDH